MIRAGRYSRRPVQADQLHVDLWWRGLNLARDAGTYLYNGEPPWNNGFSGTAVHNTVTIDGRDQMRRASRFLWIDWSQAEGRSYSSSAGLPSPALPRDRFEGEHDGYRRFAVTHRRMVRWLPDAGWVIVDDILGAGEHEARLHWLLADLPLDVSYDPFQVILNSVSARFRCTVFASSSARSAVIRAGKSSSEIAAELAGADLPLLGWESPTYGELRPAVSILYDARAQLPLRFVTVFLANEDCRIRNENDQLIIGQGELELYRVSLAAEGRA
jgi:asparagine synthase (glutamine-hydrolysing)